MGVGHLWEVVAHRDSTVFHMEGSKRFINRGHIVKKNLTLLKEGKGHYESLVLSA